MNSFKIGPVNFDLTARTPAAHRPDAFPEVRARPPSGRFVVKAAQPGIPWYVAAGALFAASGVLTLGMCAAIELAKFGHLVGR